MELPKTIVIDDIDFDVESMEPMNQVSVARIQELRKHNWPRSNSKGARSPSSFPRMAMRSRRHSPPSRSPRNVANA